METSLWFSAVLTLMTSVCLPYVPCKTHRAYGYVIRVADKDHDQYREDARELMRVIQEKCVEYDPDRKLSIIVEYIAGKVTQTIDRLIALYRPDSVVVGTRGQRSMMQAWAGAFGAPGVGSVSK